VCPATICAGTAHTVTETVRPPICADRDGRCSSCEYTDSVGSLGCYKVLYPALNVRAFDLAISQAAAAADVTTIASDVRRRRPRQTISAPGLGSPPATSRKSNHCHSCAGLGSPLPDLYRGLRCRWTARATVPVRWSRAAGVKARACVCCTAALHCGMTTVRQLGGARFALSLNRYERKKNVALAIDVRRPAPAGSVLHTPIRKTWRSWRTRVHQQRRVCRCACECMCVQAWAEARRRLLVGAHPVSTLVIAGAMPSCCNVATLQRVATQHNVLRHIPVSTPVITGAVPADCCAVPTLARARPAAIASDYCRCCGSLSAPFSRAAVRTLHVCRRL
jgi:hypothetical protein